MSAPGQPRLRTLVATVEDVPGVLNRVASLFRRRNYNIASLTVGASEVPGLSRLTVVVSCDDATAARLEANLWKLVDVVAVDELAAADVVERDLALIKVKADHTQRALVVQAAELFAARVVDVAPTELTIEIAAPRQRIDDLRAVLEPFGVIAMVRTGAVAMARAGVGAAVPQPPRAASGA
ncbi:MAG: acetolactate synthase small subunit [Myxococcales bacterium]|nr:acetolactate synthase small subunit [Myxococcales bacterium]MBK7194161.1 acetolactate synthase small subunit [Myxococcales bacterium]MBP6843289.1 acetolactate synthase small subunit [Kofleriaceae bacterium]